MRAHVVDIVHIYHRCCTRQIIHIISCVCVFAAQYFITPRIRKYRGLGAQERKRGRKFHFVCVCVCACARVCVGYIIDCYFIFLVPPRANMPPKVSRSMSSSSVEAGSGGSDAAAAAAAGGGGDSIAARLVPLVQTNTKFAFNSVVKVFVVASKPNYLQPWQMTRQSSCSGSGFIISGRRILTNAHVVSDYTTVRIRRHGGSEKWKADVLCINHECDLALLTVDDDAFWDGMCALEVSDQLPHLYENVMVVGYPMGGDTICVTRGVVSRVTTLQYEGQKYHLCSPPLLAIQIDAAINSGNSGGPVIQESAAGGSVVGVAFSGYAGSADNIGYIIPYPVIRNFIAAYDRTGKSERVCEFGFSYMLCENAALRAKLKLKEPNSGVLVTKVAPLGAAHAAGLKSGDIVMSLKGTKVANDGTIDFRADERVAFNHVITTHLMGEPCECVILRGGRKKTLTVTGGSTPSLVEMHRTVGDPATYLIVGGLVFVPLTVGLLDAAVETLSEEAWQASRAPMTDPDDQIIVIITILAHQINHGYSTLRIPLLHEFNGKKMRNIRELRAAVQTVDTGFLDFTLATGKSIVLDAEDCRKHESEILSTYRIPAPCSVDVLAHDNSAATAAATGKGKAISKPKPKPKPEPKPKPKRATKSKASSTTVTAGKTAGTSKSRSKRAKR